MISYGNFTSFRNRNLQSLCILLVAVAIVTGWQLSPASQAKQGRSFSSDSVAARLNGRIAFTNDNWIYSVNPDGSGEIVLSTATGASDVIDGHAAWSPDGTKIAFSRKTLIDNNSAIWLMDADGKNQRKLSTDQSSDDQPTWSSDGSKIAFVGGGVNKGDIFVMSATDGNNVHSILSSPESDLDPEWSPGGSKIAFVSLRDSPGISGDISRGFEIYVVNVDAAGDPTGAPLRLTNNGAADLNPSWSPAGDQIVFNSQRDNLLAIYQMDSSGNNQQNISGTGSDDFSDPTWSPDGQFIAFTNYSRVPHSNSAEVYLLTLQGGAITRVTNTVYNEHELAWQPLPSGAPTPTPTPLPSPSPIVYTNFRISGSVLDVNSIPVPDVELSFAGELNTTPVILQTDAAGIFTYNYPPDLSFTVRPAKNGYIFNPTFAKAVSSGMLSGNFGMVFTAIPVAPNPNNGVLIPATSGAFENQGKAQVTVTRTGDLSAMTTLKYHSADGTAAQKSDYTFVSGTLRFAANESAKTISIPIADDVYPEADETFTVEFESGLQGVFVPTTVTIVDNDSTTPPANPVDDPPFYVRQHYYDFLSRTPDPGGLDYWTGQITMCNSEIDPQLRAACLHNREVAVSAAFFIELEFQDTGFFVYRLYQAAFGRKPTYQEFISDRSKVIGGAGAETSKQTLVYEWVQRPEFRQAYPFDFNVDFINKLFDSAGLTPFATERQQELAAMNAGRTRAQVLRDVAELEAFKQREYNPAFVLMQYFGYLRRNPEPAGYDFWLNVLNSLPAPTNYHAMVCAFITSGEYQDRFGAVRTHNNGECSP